MGGMDQLLKQARASFENGDHKWVAEVLRHAVFADPSCEEARLLQADAFEQLAWRAESGLGATYTCREPKNSDTVHCRSNQ
ncbi:MAG: hypothetical protein Ct9H300mP12_11290 [Acidimicrobiales bacterium]|nr:MAG: hypothetical protein Ct9H300mP12_11290 [Acidimicrobiales bacterium]